MCAYDPAMREEDWSLPIYISHYYGELIDGEGVGPSQALIFARKGAFHISLNTGQQKVVPKTKGALKPPCARGNID